MRGGAAGRAPSEAWICPRCGRTDPSATAGSRCINDDAAFVAPSTLRAHPNDPLLGQTIGKYVVYDMLGAGGFGAVYGAVHTMIDLKAAIKVLHLSSGGKNDIHLRDRFNREARILAGIKSPAVVGVHDFGDEDGLLYMVLEWVEGEPLSRVVKAAGRLEPDRAIALTRKILAALEVPHARGLVHRDLKPANIMITTSGSDEHVKLIDFGIARRSSIQEGDGTALTMGDAVVGTPRYMAPEQFRPRQDIDARTDLFSVGVILYTMLAGTPPLSGTVIEIFTAHHEGHIPPLPSGVDVPPGLLDFLNRAMAKAPADRFPDAEEMARALDDLMCAAATKRPIPSGGLRRWLVPMAVLGAVLASIGFGSWLVAPGHDASSKPVPRVPQRASHAVPTGILPAAPIADAPAGPEVRGGSAPQVGAVPAKGPASGDTGNSAGTATDRPGDATPPEDPADASVPDMKRDPPVAGRPPPRSANPPGHRSGTTEQGDAAGGQPTGEGSTGPRRPPPTPGAGSTPKGGPRPAPPQAPVAAGGVDNHRIIDEPVIRGIEDHLDHCRCEDARVELPRLRSDDERKRLQADVDNCRPVMVGLPCARESR